MTVDDLHQRQLDERVLSTSPGARLSLVSELRQLAIEQVWAQADRAGPMTELERARFLLRRLYPDLEGPRLAAILAELERDWRAGRWTGFRRPDHRRIVTVREAAQRADTSPATIRRLIRSGRLKAHRIGAQYVIEERDLEPLLEDEALPVPPDWSTLADGRPSPNVVRAIRRSRLGH